MLGIIKALGTQHNTESAQTILLVDRAPRGGELRSFIKYSKLLVKRRLKTNGFSLLWFSNIKVSWCNDYFVVHYLKDGRLLSYTKREYNIPMTMEKMEALYVQSIGVVEAKLKSEGVWPSLS